jgi:hypothetical protein
MYFFNYQEVKLSYIYFSSLRFIMLKQNYLIDNHFFLILPCVKLSFIFLKIIELNNLKIINNIIFL